MIIPDMSLDRRAIVASAVISTAAGFGLGRWIIQPAIAPSKEMSSLESPLVSITSPANSSTSTHETIPSVNSTTFTALRKYTGRTTISIDGVKIDFDEQNPEVAIAKIQSLPDQQLQRSLIRATFSAWAKTDFDAALRGAVGLQNLLNRSEALEALTMVQVETDQIDNQALFAAIVDNMPSGESYRRAITRLFSSWADQDPAAAAQAVMELPPSAVFANAAAAIAGGWASLQGNRSEPLQWAMSLPQGEARNASLANIMDAWAADDPAAAGNYAIQFKQNLTLNAIKSIAEQWSRSEPRQALAWVNRVPWQEQQNRTNTLAGIMQTWAQSDPVAAANEALRLPVGDSQAAIGPVVGSWASADTDAAAAWVNQLSAGSAKDGALAAVALKIAQEDPATAMNWAAAIGEQGLRQKNIAILARDWLRQDKVAATAWISSAPIPEKTRKTLLGR